MCVCVAQIFALPVKVSARFCIRVLISHIPPTPKQQLQKTTVIAPQLRPLANSINLRFDDFAILEGVRGVVSGRRAFHPAIWANQTHVTLALSVDCQQMSDLCAITEFCDLVPNHYLPLMPNPERQLVQGEYIEKSSMIFEHDIFN